MYPIRKFVFGITSCLLLNAAHVAQAIQSPPTPTSGAVVSLPTHVAQAGNNAHYKQAEQYIRKTFGEPKWRDYYDLYVIVDRLARANGLDDRPWRIRTIPTYDINAFATEVNLLAFFDGLLDQVDGDRDALACVAAHEMAHHTQKHIPVSVGERQQILQRLRQEVVDEVTAENEDLRKDLNAMDIGAWVTGTAGQVTGRTGGILGGVIGGVLQSGRRRRIAEAEQRIKTIYAEKEEQRKKEWRELSHRHEFEADKFGYQYMVRAGYNPRGCITVFNVIERMPTSQLDSDTHPSTSDRIAKMNALTTQYPPAKLANEGRSRMASSSKPLGYGISRDGQSLQVKSRAGSNR